MFIAHGSFFLPDRPTAGKTLVKNPPFKESTNCRLRTNSNIHCHVYTLWQKIKWIRRIPPDVLFRNYSHLNIDFLLNGVPVDKVGLYVFRTYLFRLAKLK